MAAKTSSSSYEQRSAAVPPEVRRNTIAAFTTLLVITTGHTLLETARDALFLAKVPASQLPWMYLVIVLVALGLQNLKKMDKKGAIAAVLIVAGLFTSGFYFLAHNVASRLWVLYALYVWSGLVASWVMVQFWTLLGRVYDSRQARMVYATIGAGAVLGGVVGAFAARGALAFFHPRTMLLGSAVLFTLAAIPVLAIKTDIAIPDPNPPLAPVESDEGGESSSSSLTTGVKVLWQNAFARRILGIVLVATVSVTLADFLFKARIAEAFPNDTRTLAAWLSTFYAVTNTISLVAQLVIGPWIFRTVGVQRALFLFPLLLLGCAGSVLLTAALGTAIVLKGVDGTMRYSVHKTSTELLLVAIPDGIRERIKPIIDLIGSRGGQAIASLAILALVAIGAASTRAVAALVVVLTLLWTAIVVTIRGHYLDTFRETLRAGGLSGNVELPELDLGALEMLFAGLNSSRDIEVLASLELLAEQHRERLIPALILYHPSREVVLRALDLFTQRGRADFVSIADRLNGHPDREVAAAALRARTSVLPDRKLLEERLTDDCPQVSATALISLIARGWIEPTEADRRVRELIATRSWQTAAEMARTIRDVAADPSKDAPGVRARFDDLLIRLAREAGQFRDMACAPGEDDDDRKRAGAAEVPPAETSGQGPRLWGTIELHPPMAVRLEVAKAMAARKQPAYLPILVGMLNRHELRATARAAIAQIPGGLDFVHEILGHRDYARNIRVHLPRTLVLFEPEAAAKKLMEHLATEEDGAVRFKVLRALVKLRRANRKLVLDQAALTKAAEALIEHASELRDWARGLSGTNDDEPPPSVVGADPLRAAHHLLLDLIRDKESHAVQRLFMLLELIYHEDFETIERGLRSKRPKTRANSLELIENVVRSPLREGVLGLVDPSLVTAAVLSYEETIQAVLLRGGRTMQTLAEYRAIQLGLDVGAITGDRPSRAPTIESIGKRLVDRARDLLNPDTSPELRPVAVTK